ncbi:hypothetical protein BS50DRAFT_571366 [Corynespora cassiicola Philippines]|uniref:SnoaL-like domain-containing protein n=1 Tax=Corynespora cassiicola Philippines TaxID=1448308 RepID=A0A2T2NXA9_CORCC|nr:hypothetical protein BS50DRAFT_571366 [Corynespora cassiicola Philippines]
MSGPSLPPGTPTNMTPVEEATARILITSLIHRYASVGRETFPPEYIASLFEPDGMLMFPDGQEVAPSRLIDILGGSPPEFLLHHVTTVDVQFVSEDEARCQTYLLAQTDVKTLDHWGRWEDVVKKQVDGRWLFKRKILKPDGGHPDGWYAGLLANVEKSPSESGKI